MANVSPDIQWQVIRNNSSFLRRQRGIPKQFSVEKFNVMGVNSIRHNGLIHKKAIDVRPAPDNDGVVVTLKKKGLLFTCKFLKTDLSFFNSSVTAVFSKVV